MAQVDLLGRTMTAADDRILALYREVKAVLAQPDLPPCARANLKGALSHLWQVVNDLNLEFEQLYETHGV